ncbi:MAG: hypothetical protein OXH86_15645 [Acidimicrobiaceae bacterium]|nr:hypothetical protein [Acidimicrobiaceae bacterium]MDE0498782.1 hypothetical protein [Acidimicrobiaceae bacterium]
MDSAVIAAIVSVLGAGFLAMLFFFMRGIRADIAQLRTEMRAEFAAVRGELQAMRVDIAALQQTVSRHDGILSEQSRRLGMATS